MSGYICQCVSRCLKLRSLYASALLLAFLPLVKAQTPPNFALPVATDRIVGVIDDSDVVTVRGNTHPLAREEFESDVVAADTRLERMVLMMRPSAEQQISLDLLTTAQQDRNSRNYRLWLSPEQYGARFGVSEGDLARATEWLERHGFEVEPAPAGHLSLVFSGTAGQVAETFHTEIRHYLVQGQLHTANFDDPQIPTALSPIVAGILSLHDFRRISQLKLVRDLKDLNEVPRSSEVGFGATADARAPENTQGNSHYLFPSDFATIYDLKPLYSSGKSGLGTTIAIVGRSNINLSDVGAFRSYAGLPVKPPSILLSGPDPGLVPGDQDEATLDVEWAGGVAPAAKVILVAAKSTATSDGVDLAALYIVNHKTASVMSTSFGSCESSMGATETAFYNSLWQQASAEGISVFVSSGDSGASGCEIGSDAKGSGAAVNGLCSPPYATCVGGTEFNDKKNSSAYWSSSNDSSNGSALSYIPETVWNESSSDSGSGLWASGGGISQNYVQPNWQKSVTGANSNGMRAVPDVALNAASHDGYLVELNGNWYDFAGTSAASPTMAAIMALVVQSQSGVGPIGRSGLGNVNPALYGFLSAWDDPFHATPSGNNSVPGVGGFVASGAAYNLATGLGSVDANVLVADWPTASKSPQPSFKITPSVSSVSVISGSTAKVSLMLTASGGFLGAVSLTASKLPLGITVQFNPSLLKAGSTSTVTLTATNSAAAGAGTILITGTSGDIESSTALAVTVRVAPTLAIVAQAVKITAQQGKSATATVKVNTGGAFSGLLKLAVTGLPAGVSSSWSPSSFQANGTQSFSSTLTLTASVSQTVAITSFNIVASGDGLSAQAPEQLQITAAPGITIALAPAAISMKASGTGQMVVNVSPVGGLQLAASLSGVKFLASPLPVGVTASWSKPAITASGAIQTVLTLSGSIKAAAGSSTFSVQSALTDPSSHTTYSVTEKSGLTLTK